MARSARAAPEAEGAPELSPAFNLGNPQNKRFALMKGARDAVPDEAGHLLPPKSQSAQLGPATIWAIGLASVWLGRSIWRPFSTSNPADRVFFEPGATM